MKRKLNDLQITYNTKSKKRKIESIPKQIFNNYYKYKNAELKFFEDTQDVSAITTTGIIAYISLNRIAQGNGESNRVGRKCVIKKINLRGELLLPSQTSIANGTNTIRVIVYLDKQCNGATATVTNILQSADERSFNNLSNSQRFRILKDWFVAINSTYSTSLTTFGTGPMQKILTMNKKCNIPIEFSGTTSNISSISSNNIGVMAICSNVGSSNPTIVLTSRVRFSDG